MKSKGAPLLEGVESSKGDALADTGTHPDQYEWEYKCLGIF